MPDTKGFEVQVPQKKEKFKKWWRKTWKRILPSTKICLVCGTSLYINNIQQVVKYCSKKCRRERAVHKG
jgi:hypothetical protein